MSSSYHMSTSEPGFGSPKLSARAHAAVAAGLPKRQTRPPLHPGPTSPRDAPSTPAGSGSFAQGVIPPVTSRPSTTNTQKKMAPTPPGSAPSWSSLGGSRPGTTAASIRSTKIPFIPLANAANPLMLPMLSARRASGGPADPTTTLESPRSYAQPEHTQQHEEACSDPCPEDDQQQQRCSTASSLVVAPQPPPLVHPPTFHKGGATSTRLVHGSSGVQWSSDMALLGRPSKRSQAKPKLLEVMEDHVSKELRQLDGAQGASATDVLQVYKEAFRMFICAFESYAPVLSRVEASYDAAFTEQRDISTKAFAEKRVMEGEFKANSEIIASLRQEKEDLLLRLANQERRHQKELMSRANELKQVSDLKDALKEAKLAKEAVDKERVADAEKVLTLIRTARESENRVRTLDRELRKSKNQNEQLMGVQKALSSTQLELRDFKEKYKHKVPLTHHDEVRETLQREVAHKDHQVRQMRRLCAMRSCEMGMMQRQFDQMKADLHFEAENGGSARPATPRPEWRTILQAIPSFMEETTAISIDETDTMDSGEEGHVPYPQARELRSTRLIVEDMGRRIAELTDELTSVKTHLQAAQEALAAAAATGSSSSPTSSALQLESPFAPPTTFVAPIEGTHTYPSEIIGYNASPHNVSTDQISEHSVDHEPPPFGAVTRKSFNKPINRLNSNTSLRNNSAAGSPSSQAGGGGGFGPTSAATGTPLLSTRGISVAVPPFLRAVGSIRRVPITLEENRQIILKLFHEYVRRNVDWKNPRCRVAYGIAPFFEDVANNTKGVVSGATLRLNSLTSHRYNKWEASGASSGMVSLAYNVVAAAEYFQSRCPLCAWFLGVIEGSEPVHIIYDALTEYSSLRDQVNQLGDLHSKSRVKKASVMESLGMVFYYKTTEELEELRAALGPQSSLEVSSITQLTHPFALTSLLQDVQQGMHLHKTLVNAISQAARKQAPKGKHASGADDAASSVLVSVPTLSGAVGERKGATGTEGPVDGSEESSSDDTASSIDDEEEDELVVDGRVIVCETLKKILSSVEPSLPRHVVEQLTAKHNSPSPCPPSGFIPLPIVLQRLEYLPVRRYSRAKRPATNINSSDPSSPAVESTAARLRRVSDGSAIMPGTHTVSSSSNAA